MKRVALTVAVALLIVTTGCVGLITGETIEFEAENTTVEESTKETTGYEAKNSTERTITRDVTIVGQERTVHIENHVTRYASSGNLANFSENETLANFTDNETLASYTESETLASYTENETLANVTQNERIANATQGGTAVPDLARFVVVSSPGANVAGQALNPAASWSNEEILERVSEQTGSIENIESDGTRETESLGASRTVSMFDGTTRIAGQDVDVRVHVASFEHEGDVIIAVAVHPTQIDEQADIDKLFAGIEHSGA
jgi:hypothetical protein